MNDELISQVEELGLSNKEARVYVANLMLGPAGVQHIADASGIKRVTTYVILESLVNLGLVSQTNKAKKTLFNAESPDNLMRLIEKREQSLKDQRQQLEELLPDLKAMKGIPQDAPNVRFYDSAEGIRTVFKNFIAEGVKSGVKETYGFSNLDQVRAFFPEIAVGQGNPDRIKYGLHSKFIYTSSNGPVEPHLDKDLNRETRFLPINEFPINGDITILGDRIAMLTFSGVRPQAILVQSKEIAQTYELLFKLAWEAAGKYIK